MSINNDDDDIFKELESLVETNEKFPNSSRGTSSQALYAWPFANDPEYGKRNFLVMPKPSLDEWLANTRRMHANQAGLDPAKPAPKTTAQLQMEKWKADRTQPLYVCGYVFPDKTGKKKGKSLDLKGWYEIFTDKHVFDSKEEFMAVVNAGRRIELDYDGNAPMPVPSRGPSGGPDGSSGAAAVQTFSLTDEQYEQLNPTPKRRAKKPVGQVSISTIQVTR